MSSNDTKPENVRSDDSQDKKKPHKKQQNMPRGTKFEGRCEDLKGHIYDYGDSKNADQFIMTTKEIKNYVGRTYKYGGDITAAISALSITELTEPNEPDDPDNRIAMKKWEREYDEYRKAKKYLEDNVKTLYNLVWGQCTDSMQQKIESLDTFEEIESASNGIALLVAIQNTSYNYQSQKYRIESIIEALYRLMTLRQNNMTPQQYYEQFCNMLAVYIHCGGSIEPDPGCLEYVAAKEGWTAPYTAAQKAAVREMTWANWFILHADRNRYGSLITGLQNEFLTGNDKYPKTLNDAYSRLTNWKDPSNNGRGNNTNTGVTFANVGDDNGNNTNNNKQKKNKDHITCFNCNEKGHYSNQCNKARVNVGTANTTTSDNEVGDTTTLVNNALAEENGISDVLSPRAIVTGAGIDYNKHCKIEFGAYVQTHEDHDNTMVTRTVGALALRPTGNAQGGYFFYSLNTGRVLNRTHWTEIPMPTDVINRIHILSRRNPPGMVFSNRNRAPFILDLNYEDDPDDSSFAPDDADIDDDASEGVDDEINEEINEEVDEGVDDSSDSSNNDEDNEDAIMNDEDSIDNDEDIEALVPALPEPQLDEPAEAIDEDMSDAASDYNDNDNNIDQNYDDNNINDAVAIEQQMDAQYGARISTYNLRPRKPRDYGHLHTTLEHIAMTQYSVKKGLQLFGEAGIEAVMQELKQLHDRHVIEPVDSTKLSHDIKRNALPYLMFLKEKRTGKIKGRGCADGRKQRETMSKEEVSSPTVSIESVMLSCTIDAHEERDVATIDIPGAFMQADMEGTVYMRIDGAMAELLVRLEPKVYGKYVEIINGKKVIYLLLKKALYGTLKAALLFYNKLSEVLQSWGFELNPYDRCVANKMINGKQCTILWHVDDLKISHVEAKVVTEIIELLSAEFGKEAALTINRGKNHEYLGMSLDFSEKGVAQINMVQYIKNILEEMPENMQGTSPTPAANHLFDVNPEQEKLDETQREFFHHVVAQLLFLCKRARPDIQTAVAFLCTRVTNPDMDDYKKLGRVIKYIRGTESLPLRLEADCLNITKWWVDASYAVHPDMKSHTGGVMSMGKGAIYGTSTRQKINTKSSTEAELVGVGEVMPQILWTRYFLEAQGYTSEDTIIHQDNKSSILLEENGMASSSKRTRHINIRYYFVTDRINKNEVRIEYCPTEKMMADFFTKPLQGQLFTIFRDFIMNVHSPHAHAFWNERSVLNIIYMDKGSEDKNEDPRSGSEKVDGGGFTLVTRKGNKKQSRKMNKSAKVRTIKTGKKTG